MTNNENKYNADKLAEALSKVNDELIKVDDKQFDADLCTMHTQKYRDKLEKEITILKQKNQILEAQAKLFKKTNLRMRSKNQ